MCLVFSICALIFTASYFLLSLAIRDPIPMIDEIAISVGLTLLGWNALGKTRHPFLGRPAKAL